MSPSVNQPSQSGTNHACNLKDRRSPCHRIPKMLLRYHLRNQGLTHRTAERSGNPDEKQYCEDGKDRMDSCPSLQKQKQRAKRIGDIASKQYATSIKAIGSMTSSQRQENARQKLNQADIAQVQRPVRNLEDLPSHCDRLHFGAND